MFSIRHLAVAVIFLLGLAGAVYAGEEQPDSSAMNIIKLKNQTHCPVMGGKIDSTVYTDIQGQRVYHCCAGCSAPLKKDPDKYFQKAVAEGVLFENIQTTCPVSGMELKDKSVYVDFEGRRIVFCCEGCISKFTKEPQKYLSRLDNPEAGDIKKSKKMDHGSQDQSECNH